jgi:NAD(P)H-quinone oxidoreductase subunit 5
MLHLVAHSLYKAHAFLASGSGVDAFRAPAIPAPGTTIRPQRVVIALGAAGLMALLAATVFEVSPLGQPALVATGIVVAIAVSQLLLQASMYAGSAAFVMRALGLSAIVCIAYFALHAVFEHALHGSVLPMTDPASAQQWILATLVVAVFVVLLALQLAFNQLRTPSIEALYVHLYNGLYIDVYITRWLQRLWPGPAPASFATARS